jgi:Semialdehyde dehydrogenase, dimerisation domain
VTLKPLLDCFGVQRVVMTSLQGVSGAGLSPGVVALDILDNVIPYIPGEEEIMIDRACARVLRLRAERAQRVRRPPGRPDARVDTRYGAQRRNVPAWRKEEQLLIREDDRRG